MIVGIITYSSPTFPVSSTLFPQDYDVTPLSPMTVCCMPVTTIILMALIERSYHVKNGLHETLLTFSNLKKAVIECRDPLNINSTMWNNYLSVTVRVVLSSILLLFHDNLVHWICRK